jgi:hypothetical protein
MLLSDQAEPPEETPTRERIQHLGELIVDST